jgi:thioredoxin-dependent peroxiredoxin
MSKKTRKKSSKRATGRGAAKATSAKAKKAGAAKAKTASAKGAKKFARKTAKGAKTRKAAASKTNPVITPVRKVGSLNEGDTAPAFSLPRDGGQLVSLGNYAGRKLVIFFYPRADTPGCTLEAIAFSRLANAFAAAQTAVLGVSADPLKAQESFRDKHELSVPLVSDEKLGMLKAYGVWGEKSMYGKTFMGIVRTTVLINGHGKIQKIWRNVRVDGHADEVLAAARTP